MDKNNIEYNKSRLKKVADFEIKVNKEGCSLIKKILTPSWFNELKIGGEKVWLGTQKNYDCKFFPFRWLCEENEWDRINNALFKLENLTKKKIFYETKLKH